MLNKFANWMLGDLRRRIHQLSQSLDVLEERYVSLRADVYRLNRGRR